MNGKILVYPIPEGVSWEELETDIDSFWLNGLPYLQRLEVENMIRFCKERSFRFKTHLFVFPYTWDPTPDTKLIAFMRSEMESQLRERGMDPARMSGARLRTEIFNKDLSEPTEYKVPQIKNDNENKE